VNTSIPARALAAGCALALTLAACGGDDDDAAGDAADTPVAQALADELLTGDSPISTEDEARCVSGEIVNGVGEDRLDELGVTADSVGSIQDIDFTDGELETIVDSMFECVDMEAAMAEEFAEEFGEEGAQCFAENLDQELMADLMTSSFAGDDAPMSDEFFQAFLDIASECDLPLN
jgi:hypothetical protein